MTFKGAICQLAEIRDSDFMPSIFTPAMNKVIETLLDDAQEIRHGYWEQYSVYGDINFRCSECGKAKFHNGEMIRKYRYCYYCGAKMDEQVTGKLPASEEEE